MSRSAWIAAALVFTAAATALAQGNTPPSPQVNETQQLGNRAPQGNQPSQVLGQTGTMYDGNNADLRLPPQPNAWYEDKWAGYVPEQPVSPAPAAATGPGTAGAALGTKQTGGEH